ncbi:nucleolar complex protein 4 homolog B [Caerostris darwini]|uniref:Nucleolar complex protein 4 homolog B n=1 Tax=Caerostris darwini TaxID=1538125 RepID=A0AAV4UTM3_9ARAC|nr:nucleolar complex protein 4 homolog B [Caerostris darwini]
MIVEKILQSKKNANCILDLEKAVLSNDEGDILSGINTYQELLNELHNRNMIQITPGLDENEVKYRRWLADRKNDFVNNLLVYLNHTNEQIQETSIDVLMALIKLEGVGREVWNFPKELFGKIIHELLSAEVDQQANILRFQKYASHDDIIMYTLKTVKAILDIFDKTEEVTNIFLANLFYLLNVIKYPKKFQTDEPNTLLPQNNLKEPFFLKKKFFCKLFSDTWLKFLKLQLPFSVLKKVLLILHKRVVPYLQNPCLLLDFLTDSYDRGGILSLLSLSSLFFLIDKYNVEYPDFFQKFYSLTNAEIINGKYSARYFYLCDLFLSSTHVPAYLIAAFAKKLSRIALKSKTDNILRIIVLVINFIIRHKSLTIMIHQEIPTDISEDPFKFEELDPARSCAMDSSLWEIKTLQSHIIPEIARKAKMINHSLPSIELEFHTTLDVSMDSLYKKERKRKFEEVALAVKRPVISS